MSNHLRCHICGVVDATVSVWVMGPYSLNACDSCGDNSPQMADGAGNRMERLRDVEARRFSEGVAGMAKTLG